MNALGQEQYCNSGVQFHEIIKDNPPGPLVTQEWLPADQTLPDELLTPGHHRRRSKPAIQHIEIFSCSGSLKKLHKSHDKPMMFSARITHSNSEQTTHTFKYFTAGRHRVAYTTPGYDWIVKWQCLNGSKNQNLEEWNKSKQMGTMNSFIPETDFYTQMRIGHMEISLLILQKVSLTFAEMIKLFSTTQPTQATMATVTGAATIVVIQLAQVSHAGLKPDDWHIRNIAFDDDDEKPQLKGFKLIDWADNHTANAPLLLRERMHKAFRQFSDCFQDFTSWGQHPRGLMHAHIWDTFMKSLHHTLTDWWSEWSMSVAGQDVDALPDDEHISQLHDRFQKIVFGLSSMHHLPRAINSGKAADQQNASILFAVRDHRSSGTFVLDTERPSLLRFSQMTRSPSNSTDQESMDSHLRARKTQGLYPFSTYTNIGQKGEVLMAEFEETTACTAKIEAQAPELLNFIRKDRDVQVGEAAVRGLLDAAMAMHHRFAVNLFRHGRSTAEDPGTSVPLQERWYNYIHGHRHAFPVFRPPENSMEGDDIRTIFQLFLEQVQDRGHLSRMQNAPRISYNVDKLHAAWWIKFTADITWCTMTTTAKRTHVRDWLFKKFTTDPKRKCMSPLPPAKRIKSDAKWPDFDIDDTELEVIVTSIFDQYVALPGIQS